MSTVPPRALRPVSRSMRLCALAWALVAGPAVIAAENPKAAQFYEDALVRYEKNDLPGAIIQLKNAIQADRKILPAHVLLGKVLLASSQAPAAEVEFAEALQLGVNRAEVVVLLARALVSQGKQPQVLEDKRFELAGLPASVQARLLLIKAAAFNDLSDARSALKAIEDSRAIDPGVIESWLAEVPVRIRARQFKEALAAVERARAIDPASAAMHYEHGSLLHVQGNIVGALAAYDKALAAAPAMADARLARAGIYLDLKRYDAAAQDVAALLEKTPLEPRGWYLSAALAEHDGRPQVARSALAKVTALIDPVPIQAIRFRPQVLMLNGQAHYGLGEREKARPYFEAFDKAQPGSPVSKMLANIYQAEGNQDKAADSLELYLRAFPNDAQAMAMLASAYMAKGRNARAAELMQRALRSNDAPELYTAYGLSLLGTGQNDSALAQLEKAYKKDPGQTPAAYALVGLYLRSNQVPKALAVAAALVKSQPANPSFQNLLGLAHVQERDLAGARAAFEQAFKLDPTMLPAKINLARLENDAKNYSRAEQLLNEVLKADDLNTDAMYEVAVMAERRARPDEALRWLQRAFDTAGTRDLRVSLALVDLHMRAGRRADALKAAQQLADKAPDSLPVLIALARVQLSNGDTAGAKATLTTATRVAPYDASIQVEIALLQLAANNVPGAAYCLDKALSAKPDHLPAQVLMTEVDLRQGELPKAEARAQQILKKAPKLPIGMSLLGDVAMARKQPAVALDFYRKAYQVEPSTDTLGRLFLAQAGQDMKAAVALADQWLKTHPADLATRRMLAEAHVRSNNMPGALQEFERIRQLLPKDAGVLNDLANVLLRMKDARALQFAEQALAVAPNDARVIDTAGWALYSSGSVDRALPLLRDARLRAPESPTIRYHLAAALSKSGRQGEAREELQAALAGKTGFDGRDEAETLLRSIK